MLRHCAYIVTLVPSVLRWRLAETKPGARRTETSVASVRFNEPSLACRFNREHVDQGHYIAFRRNRGHSVASFKEGRDRPELVPELHVMHLLTGDEVGRSLQEGPQVLALHVDSESFGAAPAIA